jgi:hypothetical protein
MIDSRFIIRYTNGLYSTDPENAPTYKEFRDMFSSGQIGSKEWAVNALAKLNLLSNQDVIIVGSWYGTLGLMLKQKFPYIGLKFLDIDPRCEVFLKNIIYDLEEVEATTGDMYQYNYHEYLVINTACEHIPDIKAWLGKLPKGTLVLLQSNNFFNSPGHINCATRIEEFEEQVSLSKILYSGEFQTQMYTRYMIIGKV